MFDVVYLKGKDNVVADPLSRINVDELSNISKDENINMVTTRGMKMKERVRSSGIGFWKDDMFVI